MEEIRRLGRSAQKGNKTAQSFYGLRTALWKVDATRSNDPYGRQGVSFLTDSRCLGMTRSHDIIGRCNHGKQQHKQMGDHERHRFLDYKKKTMARGGRKDSHGTNNAVKIWREDTQPQICETTVEKGVDASMIEYFLKGMEELKIAVVKKMDEQPNHF